METFELPQDSESFLTHTNWEFCLLHKGKDFEVSMQEIDDLDENDELSFLKIVVVGVINKIDEALNLAANELLEDYNTTWADGSSLERTEFMKRLNLQSISIWDRDYFSMDFSDDDMFWGHDVVVRFGKNFELEAVTIEG